MPKKKLAARPKKTSKRSRPDKETVAHYTAVLVEDLRSDFKFVIESVQNLDNSLNKRIDDLHEEMDERFNGVELVLKRHSELLEQNEGRWIQNEERWQKNEERWQKNEERWQKNDERLDRIETKLDSVIETVKEHDVVLKRLTG